MNVKCNNDLEKLISNRLVSTIQVLKLNIHFKRTYKLGSAEFLHKDIRNLARHAPDLVK